MTPWQLTKRKNKYDEYGQYVWLDYILLCVYRRKYGWGFTTKAWMLEGFVSQVSSDKNAYYVNAELAKMDSLRAASCLKEMFEPDVISVGLTNLIHIDELLRARH